MKSLAIFFEFDKERDALLALDTLEELGYSPKLQEDRLRPTLHIHLDDQDLTSALEITQAHGGRLVEQAAINEGESTFAMAYDLEDTIPIPAHVVNEDWTEDYSKDYNHFPPGVRF
ncbi:hypothetical protein [Paenibacillus eucommiae]|uniref:Uncharacterized protein n=1 Tax=Paenibacillus eucommiae TaxID=1355755 RepID=A0ABS4IXR3_9BACL|nr:hypothetical protein [Paenibacillus eucommiae]MBP1992379.1 hypothetical protein [Paenibacillus eucommiae]